MDLLESKINDANQLLTDTHNYLKWQAPLDIEYMPRDGKLKVCCEALRLTVRITRIVSWLTLQRAILDGELSQEDQSTASAPILEDGRCLESASENDTELPLRLRELLKKSRALYVQMMRLEHGALKDLPHSKEMKKKKNKRYYVV